MMQSSKLEVREHKFSVIPDNEQGVEIVRADEDASFRGELIHEGSISKDQVLVFDGDDVVANFHIDETMKAVNWALGYMQAKKKFANEE